MKNVITSPWTVAESESDVHIVKVSVTKEHSAPICSQHLVINRTTQAMSLTRNGEEVNLSLLAPKSFADGKFVQSKASAKKLMDAVMSWKGQHLSSQDIMKGMSSRLRSWLPEKKELVPSTRAWPPPS